MRIDSIYRFYAGENVSSVSGLNLHQLRKDAYTHWFCFRPFSFCSSYTLQGDQPTRVYSNVCFDDISCPKGEILASRFSMARLLKWAWQHAPRIHEASWSNTRLLGRRRQPRPEKSRGSSALPQNHWHPQNFRISIFLDLWIQHSKFWLEVENKVTKSDQEPPRGKAAPGQSDPWGPVERAAQPLLPLQGPNRGLKTPPLEQLFVDLEGSKGIELRRPNWTTVKTNLVSGSIAVRHCRVY